MFDYVPKMDLCEQQINAYLDIPTEVWTDIFMLLPRRTLVQRVQPVNKVFKAICDRNVKSIHIIEKSEDFMWKLGLKKAVAQRQLEALAGHGCALAKHFRMTDVQINYNYGNEAKLAVLRHSLDLLRHCQLVIFPRAFYLRSSKEFSERCQAYLTLLEPAKPSYIEIQPQMGVNVFSQFIQELLRRPTTLNCPRLKLSGQIRAWDNREPIFKWLHHRVDHVDVEEHGEGVVRCLVFFSFESQNIAFSEWLLERCIQNFEESKVPEDRRCFVLTFRHPLDENVLYNFERENPATGEVLLLERVLRENGRPTGCYRLLRCSANRVANGTMQLFVKLFKSTDDFNLERQDVAKVRIS